MKRRTWTTLGISASALLLILHNERWLLGTMGVERSFTSDRALFGWLPFEMAYHLAWVVLGVGAAWMLMRGTWRTPS